MSIDRYGQHHSSTGCCLLIRKWQESRRTWRGVLHIGVITPMRYFRLHGARWFWAMDVLIPTQLFIDHQEWRASLKIVNPNDEVVICHAPNHRGFKGTEFVIEAVARLQAEGLKVRLKLLERMQNVEVRRVLQEEAEFWLSNLYLRGMGLTDLRGWQQDCLLSPTWRMSSTPRRCADGLISANVRWFPRPLRPSFLCCVN